MRCAMILLVGLPSLALALRASPALSMACELAAFRPRELRMTANWQTTSSGLRFRDAVVGSGQLPEPGKRVALQYTARVASTGEMYETTEGEGEAGEPFVFKFGAKRVISGWEEGVGTMRVGGRRTLAIPSSLAYGRLGYISSRSTRVPPDADIEIECELVDIYPGVDWSWTKQVFTLQNAGPWLILLVITVFQGLAALPREDLPPQLAELIPTVLGSQYRAP